MNVKTLLALTTACVAGAVTAAVTSANTLCRIEVNSSAASTIVSLPLQSVGTSEKSILVTDLVMTDNLTVGDSLLVPNGTSWYAWKIVESKGKKVWESTKSVEGYTPITAPDPDETPLYCGGAVWLNRQSTKNPFYLYGQVIVPTSEEDKIETTAAAGKAATSAEPAEPAYTLMGNPKPEALALNSLAYKPGSSPAVGDKIFVPADNAFGYAEYQWQTVATTSQKAWCVRQRYTDAGVSHIGYVATDATIEPGKGFWYVSFGGSPTIVW